MNISGISNIIIIGSPPKYFGDWCSHTSGSEFMSNLNSEVVIYSKLCT